MILSLAHINLLVPASTLPSAHTFYSTTLGLTPRPVPSHRTHDLAWFDIGSSNQQIHISASSDHNKENTSSSRHPCFKLGSPQELLDLRARIWEHFERGGEAAPMEADKPEGESSGEFLF
jgi:hypothetical protein